ncbi:hypothetical protein VTO73DRAFT_1630 [Trametes versicolor]
MADKPLNHLILDPELPHGDGIVVVPLVPP